MEKTSFELSPTLLKKINEKRHGLTHERLIELCVNSWLERESGAPQKPPAKSYVAREEFEEFRRGSDNLLRSFLSFFLVYWLEFGRDASETQMMRKPA
jgi:hypothetical protein